MITSFITQKTCYNPADLLYQMSFEMRQCMLKRARLPFSCTRSPEPNTKRPEAHNAPGLFAPPTTFRRVWKRSDFESEAGRTLINVHIGNLRRKLGDDVDKPRFIVSMLQRGLILKNQSEA